MTKQKRQPQNSNPPRGYKKDSTISVIRSALTGVGLAAFFSLIMYACLYNIYWYISAHTMQKSITHTVQNLARQGIVFKTYPRVEGYPRLPQIRYSGTIATRYGEISVPQAQIDFLLPFRNFKLFLPDGVPYPENWLQTPIQVNTAYAKGIILELRPHKALSVDANWPASLEINQLYMKNGIFIVDSSGFFALDNTMQPAGVLEIKAQGHEEFIRSLRNNGLLPDPLGSIVQITAASMSQRNPKAGTSYISFPLTLSNQTIRLGSLPVGSLPAFDWSTHNPPVPYQ